MATNSSSLANQFFSLRTSSSCLNPNYKNTLFTFPLKPFSSSPPLPSLKSTLMKPISILPPIFSIKPSSNLPADINYTKPKSLKSRLADGETLYGLFLLSFSPTLAEIAGLAGYDFVIVDMEHGHGGISNALPCLHALAATGTPAILRLPESSSTWAKKALDLGAQGIMFRMIESPESAKKAVSYCRYPPFGVRGAAHPMVRASNYGINDGYLTNLEDELLILCQVESEEGVKKIEEIAWVDGVDCIQMGPLDLSASLGYLCDPGNKKVREVMRAAEKGVLKTKQGGGNGGAHLGGVSMFYDKPRQLWNRGYQMICGGADISMFKMDLKGSNDEDEVKNRIIMEKILGVRSFFSSSSTATASSK